MMPLIQPLNIPSQPRTEYQKERDAFAELQVDLRPRKVALLSPRVWMPPLRQTLSGLYRVAVRGRKPRRAQ